MSVRPHLVVQAVLLLMVLCAASSAWWAPVVFRQPAAVQLCDTGTALRSGDGCSAIPRPPAGRPRADRAPT